jgi:hypothetical protein
MLSLNSKHVQHVKINLADNFKVNLITHLEVIALFSSNLIFFNTFHPLLEKIFLALANQKKELFLAAMFIGQMERNGETL